MPARRQIIRYRQPMHGQGFFGDLTREVNKGIKYVHNNHLISKAAGAAAGFAPGYYKIPATAAAIGLKMAGLGKPRRRVRRKAPAKKRKVKRAKKRK